MKMDKKEMFSVLSKRLASREIDDKMVQSIAAFALDSKFEIVGIDPCIVGTCFDIEWRRELSKLDLAELLEELPGQFGGLDIHERGIFPRDRFFNVHVEQVM